MEQMLGDRDGRRTRRRPRRRLRAGGGLRFLPTVTIGDEKCAKKGPEREKGAKRTTGSLRQKRGANARLGGSSRSTSEGPIRGSAA